MKKLVYFSLLLSVSCQSAPEAFSSTAYATLPERTSGTIGKDQSDYFVDVIEEHHHVRWTFVLIHKPTC
jgi:hypothetical protein